LHRVTGKSRHLIAVDTTEPHGIFGGVSSAFSLPRATPTQSLPSARGRRLVSLGHQMRRSFRLSLAARRGFRRRYCPFATTSVRFRGQKGVHTGHECLEGAKWHGATRAQRRPMLNHRLTSLGVLVKTIVTEPEDGVHRSDRYVLRTCCTRGPV
jgi:hypothetical protein